MPLNTPGRHRRPGRLAAAAHLTRSAAIAATSTGLIVGTAVTTATATPVAEESAAFAQDGALLADQVVAAPSDPLLSLIEAGLLSDRVLTLDTPAKAVAAPADVDPVGFGVSGFTATPPVVDTVEDTTSATPASGAAASAAATSEATSETHAQTQTQAQAAVETRTQTSASRTEQRSQAPVTQAPPAAPAPEPAPQPAPRSAAGAVGIASGLMGIPYAWGGSSPSVGFDCSGFTGYVYAQLGITLPRTAAAQQAFATPVSSPMPGDLVFFGSPAWHVGIYAGNGMIYQATNPSSVSNYMAISSIYGSVSGYGRVG